MVFVDYLLKCARWFTIGNGKSVFEILLFYWFCVCVCHIIFIWAIRIQVIRIEYANSSKKNKKKPIDFTFKEEKNAKLLTVLTEQWYLNTFEQVNYLLAILCSRISLRDNGFLIFAFLLLSFIIKRFYQFNCFKEIPQLSSDYQHNFVFR